MTKSVLYVVWSVVLRRSSVAENKDSYASFKQMLEVDTFLICLLPHLVEVRKFPLSTKIQIVF